MRWRYAASTTRANGTLASPPANAAAGEAHRVAAQSSSAAATGASRACSWRQASSTAAPFRSVLAEAAVAEVFGTLSVRVGMMRTRFERHAEAVGGDLADLGVQALAHLGAAVIHLHAAIAVDEHQRAGLVEEGGGERDAELHGRDGDAALAMRVRGVEAVDRGAARGEIAGRVQFVPDAFDARGVFDRLAVVRGVAFAIEVALAHDVRAAGRACARCDRACLR